MLFTAALAIAENELVLDAIRRQKIIVIERLREATSIALRKGDNSLTVAKARFLQAWLAHREIGLLDGGHERCSSSLI
jgi:type IV pilus biogenesis protein CpaD/CtpE